MDIINFFNLKVVEGKKDAFEIPLRKVKWELKRFSGNEPNKGL